MVDPNIVYEIVKFWLPMVSAFLLASRAYSSAKKNVAEYAEKLLSNHLDHIQTATTETVTETKKTNEILKGSTQKTEYIASQLDDHTEKEEKVWAGILTTLAVLEDRTRKSTRARR